MREFDLSGDGAETTVEGERPQKKLLPNKEQIDAISDVEFLEGLSADVLVQITKIETDLEFRPGDEDWHARARGALTAHQICRKNVERRLAEIRRNSKPPKPDEGETRLERAKVNLQKQAEISAQAAARRDAQKLILERERQAKSLAATRRIAQAIRDTSLGNSFMGLAHKMLPPDEFRAILKAAAEEVEARTAELLKNKVLLDVSEETSTGQCAIDQMKNAPTVVVEAFNPRM